MGHTIVPTELGRLGKLRVLGLEVAGVDHQLLLDAVVGDEETFESFAIDTFKCH